MPAAAEFSIYIDFYFPWDCLLIEGDIGSERTNRSVITRRTWRLVASSSRGETRSLVDVYLTARRLPDSSFPFYVLCMLVDACTEDDIGSRGLDRGKRETRLEYADVFAVGLTVLSARLKERLRRRLGTKA